MALQKSPREQSFIIAIIVISVYLVGCFFIHGFGEAHNIYWQAGLGIFLFLTSYFFVHRFFLNYVEKRLNPIYKTIQNVTLSKKAIRKSIDSKGFSEDLDKEV